MSSEIKALISTLIIGIPEEIIWVTTIFVLLKRYDLIDFKRIKENYKWLLIPALPVAILINIGKYIMSIPDWIVSVMGSGMVA
jgi:hypothetical protein